MKRCAPAAERNAGPILGVLRDVLPERGTVLEIASGTGQHAVHMARALPGITWQPTDSDPDALASIAAWVDDARLPNLRAPLMLDVTGAWPVDRTDAVVCINMIHISPWSATEALFAGADRVLPAAGLLFTYGPYRFDGRFTAPSNQAFDDDLRRRDPSWGVRDLADLRGLAADHGLALMETVAMPANNHSLIFASRPWVRRSARKKLGARLLPILELELELGNWIQWQGHGWGGSEAGKFHVTLARPLSFRKIEKRLRLPASVRRDRQTDPHYPRTDGYWCDESDTGIEALEE